MAKPPPPKRRKTPPKSAGGRPQVRSSRADDEKLLQRIAAALERLAPPRHEQPDFSAADAFAWYPEGRKLAAVRRINRVEMSLLKAAHAAVSAGHPAAGLKLVEIHREDIESLPELMGRLRPARQRFIVFCDDLSFEAEDTSYKALKRMVEGG